MRAHCATERSKNSLKTDSRFERGTSEHERARQHIPIFAYEDGLHVPQEMTSRFAAQGDPVAPARDEARTGLRHDINIHVVRPFTWSLNSSSRCRR